MAGYFDDNVILGVNLGLTAIMILPIFAMFCASFWIARRNKDPARVAFTYLKVTIPLTFLWLAMYTIEGALELVFENGEAYWWTNDDTYIASLRTSLLGSLFSDLAGLLLAMTLVELGNGFLFCLTETRTALQRAMRNAGLASCIVLFIIAIASFGILNEAYSQYLESPWGYDNDQPLPSAGAKLSAAFDIILFAWAVVLMVFGVIVFKKIRNNYVLKNSAVLFLVATTLNLVIRLYGIIYVSIFVLSEFAWERKTYAAIMFLDPIIDDWIFIVTVAMVFIIALRKHNGLWTTMQPWMDGQGPPALAATSGAKGAGRGISTHAGGDEEAGRGW